MHTIYTMPAIRELYMYISATCYCVQKYGLTDAYNFLIRALVFVVDFHQKLFPFSEVQYYYVLFFIATSAPVLPVIIKRT